MNRLKCIILAVCISVSMGIYCQEDWSSTSPAEENLYEQTESLGNERSSRIGVGSKIELPNDPGKVPVGEGLLILTGLGIGYVIQKKREK